MPKPWDLAIKLTILYIWGKLLATEIWPRLVQYGEKRSLGFRRRRATGRERSAAVQFVNDDIEDAETALELRRLGGLRRRSGAFRPMPDNHPFIVPRNPLEFIEIAQALNFPKPYVDMILATQFTYNSRT